MVISAILTPEDEQVSELSRLAGRIWREHFLGIISAEQIEYMLDRFQSEHVMRRQLADEGYVYYLARVEGTPVGYAGIVPGEDEIFLSKLYVDKAYRGQGIGKKLIKRFLSDYCGRNRIRLTCNKDNKATLKAYEHMGFLIVDDVVTPIGNGMVMDDYILELNINGEWEAP